MKQLGLGLVNYHDQLGSFPTAMIYDNSTQAVAAGTQAWITNGCVMMLPYIEQQQVGQLYNPAFPWYTGFPASGPNQKWQAAGSTIPPFSCPSSSHDDPIQSGPAVAYYEGQSLDICKPDLSLNVFKTRFAAIDYAFCKGVHDGVTLYPKRKVPARELGVFNFNQPLSLRNVSDGTSNTILMGEAAQGKAWELTYTPFNPAEGGARQINDTTKPRLISVPPPFHVAAGFWIVGQPIPSSDAGPSSGTTPTVATTSILACTRDPLNRRPVTACVLDSAMQTTPEPSTDGTMPPAYVLSSINSASSGTQARMPGFRADHPGGANFVFADGSVHFLSETIEFRLPTDGVLTPDPTLNLPAPPMISPAGVYQALSTCSGQEAFSAPPF